MLFGDSANIYFDNAATTKPCAEALAAAQEAFEAYGNPSSSHGLGAAARCIIEKASTSIENLLQADIDVLFTSGGTEANNLALLGAYKGRSQKGIVTNLAEHPSVTACVHHLCQKGANVINIPLNREGILDLDSLEQALNNDIAIVSIMHVNNETGVVQDIAEAGRIIKRKNKDTLFHVDGVQGFCKHTLNLSSVDLYTISAHKIHGIKGAGALVVKRGVNIAPIFHGGGQQRGVRPGTENTPAIAAFGAAVLHGSFNMKESAFHVSAVKDRFLSAISDMEGVYVNGACCSPYIVNVSFTGVKAETLQNALNQRGIYVSTGAACHRNSKARNILKHYGLPPERLESAVRVSFCHENTPEEAEACAEVIKQEIDFLRKFNKPANGRR